MISRCSRPRKPQRKPKPRAALDSISKVKLASFRRSLPMAARRSSKSAASTGNRPQKTTDWTSLKPFSGSAVGFFSSVMVSPTAAWATSLIWAVMKPTSPGPSWSTGVFLGRKTPTRSTRWVEPDCIICTRWPAFSTPSKTRTSRTTPR
ncbi:hypothetical protein D3C80_1208590 [compost metagenome]